MCGFITYFEKITFFFFRRWQRPSDISNIKQPDRGKTACAINDKNGKTTISPGTYSYHAAVTRAAITSQGQAPAEYVQYKQDARYLTVVYNIRSMYHVLHALISRFCVYYVGSFITVPFSDDKDLVILFVKNLFVKLDSQN